MRPKLFHVEASVRCGGQLVTETHEVEALGEEDARHLVWKKVEQMFPGHAIRIHRAWQVEHPTKGEDRV